MNEDKLISCNDCKARIESIFKDLNPEDIAKIDSFKTCKSYKKGEVLFQEGAHPRGLFCVQSGKIKVSQTGIDGKEQIVHLISDGNVMGHRAILGDDTYSGSALALEDSHVCFLAKTPFYEMVENNSKLTLKIAHLLSDELKEAERKITSTAQQPVRYRIAHSILFLKKNYGLESDNATINIAIKREELANLAGTTRETATRILYELQEQKLIELLGKKIKILNEKKILELAHSVI